MTPDDWTRNGKPHPWWDDKSLAPMLSFARMLAIHRAVSGEATWDKPFEMTGLDDRTFAWTHRAIAEYLGDGWAKVPPGPHCENTKSWPFCLSAAGLGLQLTDHTLGTSTHWVYDRWVEEAFKKKYMGFDQRGRLNACYRLTCTSRSCRPSCSAAPARRTWPRRTGPWWPSAGRG